MINKWCLADSADSITVLHSPTLINPDGIAVDWSKNHLFQHLFQHLFSDKMVTFSFIISSR
jgi:hypothetical protein